MASSLDITMSSSPPSTAESAILKILLYELPDPDACLFIQPLPEFSIFTIFQQLPTELRLMIIKNTFKPRKVKLEAIRGPRVVLPSGGVSHFGRGFNSRNPPPPCLQLNRESREFGLKHYEILIQDGKHPHHVKYLNVDIDSLDLGDWSIPFISRIHVDFDHYVGEAFKRARVMFLKDNRCDLTEAFAPPQNGLPQNDLAISGHKHYLKRAVEAGQLKNLNALHIQWGGKDRHGYYFSPRGGSMERELLPSSAAGYRDVFAKLQERFPDLKVPEVIFHSSSGMTQMGEA